MITYKQATIKQLEAAYELSKNSCTSNYNTLPKCFVDENKNGMRKTFFIFNHDEIIGQVTLALHSQSGQVHGQKDLANNKDIANVCALRIKKEYEGKSIASGLMKFVESWAIERGIKTLTIGVEPCEVRNMQIYFHWGYTDFIKSATEPEDDRENTKMILVLYYSKKLIALK